MTTRNAADYTEAYILEAGCDSFIIRVKPGTDLDSRFTALEVDSGEFITVNGWTCSFEKLQQYVVYSCTGHEIGRFDTLEEAMQLANSEGNCEVKLS